MAEAAAERPRGDAGAGVETQRAESWAHLHELLFEGAWRPALRRYRSQHAFRGVNDCDCDTLRTSLARLGGDYVAMEGHLLRNFEKYAQQDSVEQDSVWNWLALAKHYGLPTRLLDWSFSPYVALHFATDDLERFDRDGVVWAADYHGVQAYLPDRLRGVLDEEGADVFTARMLLRAASSLHELEELAGEPFVVFFEPPSLDARIVNQYALFSLMSSASASLSPWLAARPGLARQIVIPAQLKWEVRDKLDQANITERVLFPGLDGLSRWLKRQYTPRV